MERELILRQNTHRATAGEISKFPKSLSRSRDILEKTDIVLATIAEVMPPERAVIFDSAENRAEKVKGDFFLSPKWLIEEVAKEKKKLKENGGTPWYHLAGTGFYVKEQVSQLLRNTKGISSEIVPDVLERELSKVKVDMEAFEQEYLKQMASLTWNLDWKTVNGQKRVICPDYGDVLWESVTDKKEREGAVYETLFGDPDKGTEGVEGWLREAPPNSFAVIVSPRGWSGLTDANNQAIVFPESQVYAVKTLENGGLQAFTFRCNANISQNEYLQEKLGLVVGQAADHKDRVKKSLKNAALIRGDDPERKVSSFEEIVDLMQQSVEGRIEAHQGKTFAEIQSFLKNPEKFASKHTLTSGLVERFLQYARWQLLEDLSIDEIEINLQIGQAISVLQLNKLYREEERVNNYIFNGKGGGKRGSERLMQSSISYKEEKADLELREGCAGGGRSVRVTSMGGSRTGNVVGGAQEWFICPKCGYQADGPIGNRCPGCGITKEQFARESAGPVCD